MQNMTFAKCVNLGNETMIMKLIGCKSLILEDFHGHHYIITHKSIGLVSVLELCMEGSNNEDTVKPALHPA